MKIKVVTIEVKSKETMSFIEQFSEKTGDNVPLYILNGINFHVIYEEEKMYSRDVVEKKLHAIVQYFTEAEELKEDVDEWIEINL